MLKDILENIKWYNKLYYQNQRVEFNHKKDYTNWINTKVIPNEKRRTTIIPLINQNKLDKIINKAINDEKVINCNESNLCITCLQSRIKILFNKRKLIIPTILHVEGDTEDCEKIIVNASKENIVTEELDYVYTKEGWYNGFIMENGKNSSCLTFICDECVLLDL